jgi:HlyD family secretion protein
MKKRLILAVFIVLFLAVGGLVFYAQQRNRNSEMFYSGTIEAVQSNLSFQVAGHVVSVYAAEGQAVKKGQILAELDASELRARRDQARASLDKAEKTREQLEESLAIATVNLPAEVKRAESNVELLKNTMLDAERNNDRYAELFRRGVISEKERDTVRLAYDNARSRLAEAEETLRQARSNIRKIDMTRKDLESAKAQIDLAGATLDQADIQLGYARLAAPYAGIITSRDVEPGEVVSPGREVFTLADLSRVDLKIFVDETEIGKVRPGQKVEVKIDTFPGRVFTGNVTYISPQAEFTPKFIQTTKERVKLVYLVKASIANPNLELKTGMPADAYLK